MHRIKPNLPDNRKITDLFWMHKFDRKELERDERRNALIKAIEDKIAVLIGA